jgi:hypothetical protein
LAGILIDKMMSNTTNELFWWKFSCSVCVESTTPQNIENTVTSRIGSGGFCRHLIDANVRVATNYPAVNAVVLTLQKDCRLVRSMALPDKTAEAAPAPRSKLANILQSDEGKVVAYRSL